MNMTVWVEGISKRDYWSEETYAKHTRCSLSPTALVLVDLALRPSASALAGWWSTWEVLGCIVSHGLRVAGAESLEGPQWNRFSWKLHSACVKAAGVSPSRNGRVSELTDIYFKNKHVLIHSLFLCVEWLPGSGNLCSSYVPVEA